MVKAKTNAHHKKRYGHHQRRSKRYGAVYLPYLPGVLITLFSLIISGVHPIRGTLAYATEMSIGGLLQATNTQRVNNGVAGLNLNQQLNNAAQAKANDMVTRNYWSHNTPDGQEPWVFITNAGYDYVKAGENLAYGFATSSDTVTGWMNSPTHRANLLDPDFVDVGFGFANSNNFNNSGPETVVVAMYGKPRVLSAGSTQPVAPPPSAPVTQPAPAPAPAPASTASPSPAPASQAAPAEATPAPTAASESKLEQPVTSQSPVIEPETQPVSRIAVLAERRAQMAMFAIGLLSGGAVVALLIKHSLGLRHLLRDSQRFVLHHPLFDTTMVSLVIMGLLLTRTVGIIR
jgi:hypothetical protein